MKILLVCLFALLSACSLFDRREEPPTRVEEAPQSAETKVVDVNLATNNVPSVNETVDVSTPVAPTAASTSSALSGVTPDVGLRYLRNGNTRFIKGFLRKDGQSKKDIQRVALEQKPHSIIFTSSDSRIPPEIIFDQKLGEIFVIRTVDMAFDVSAEASIQYGVEQLGIRNIVILAHGDSAANVINLMNQVLQKSVTLASRHASGDIRITGATYDLKTGKVDFK